ncbi:MAG: FHIPEP family type III secretion protein, partial [Myxococcota bacterium]|nr:FHIPEP family type III secretion protein [Myxococcota bacterium]
MDPNQQPRGVSFKETSFILVLMMTVGIMLLPLPTTMMDLLLAFSISISLILLILSVNVENPLQLSSFPSILLIGALLRLALNIASTRLILSKGDQGPDAVSRVIAAFADLVVGGNVVLGVIIFAILVTINFVVITKGSGRIAEVAARFTLDAMPGKQMSIDADLAAGLIKEEEAKERRKNLQLEANFFGAMDGASKFVRGDAIAGLIIVAVNIIGGLVIGTAQKDLSLGDAAEIYTMLTIGDGLVSQVPALLTSVAAGIITTRITSETSLGTEVSGQLFASKRAMFIAAGTLGTLGVVPGMPTMPFLALASILAFGASRVKEEKPEVPVSTEPELSTSEKDRQELEENLSMDLLEMEVGYELVPLVDMSNDGMLLKRISGIRKQIANDLGVIVQPIHMRDNLMLKPAEYRVMLSGQEIARGEIRPRRLLAMNPAGGAPNIEGEVTVEPAFGL